jgi:Tfp pilus assembly protein PilF
VLAQTALRLLGIKQDESAKVLLDEAAGLDGREPHVANALATYYLDRGQWREANVQITRALAEDDQFLPALATKVQLLYGTKRFDEAYELSKQLIEKIPDDPNLLFYHSKIAHEAHAYQAEVATLGKLIEQADALGLPVGGYRLYQGQAYAAMSEARKARESIARIKKRTGLK